MNFKNLIIFMATVCCAAALLCGASFGITSALYLFDGDLTDASPNGNDATFADTEDPDQIVPQVRPDYKYPGNKCLEVVTGSYAPSSASLQTGVFTVECWIYIDEFGEGSEGRVVQKRNPVDPLQGYELTVVGDGPDTGHLQFPFQIAGYDRVDVATSIGSLSAGQWTHIAVTYDGFYSTPSLKLYINGVWDSEDTANAGGSAATTEPLRIGYSYPGSTWYVNGYIDELRISDTALPSGSGSGVNELAWNTTLGDAQFGIFTDTLPHGAQWQRYEQILESYATTSPTWSLLSGSLPPGLQLTDVNDSVATIIGIPSAANDPNDTYTFVIQIADGADYDSQPYEIHISPNANEISLPRKGWGLISPNPPGEFLWGSQIIGREGMEGKTVVQAALLGWVESTIYEFNNGAGAYTAVTASDSVTDSKGYWIYSHINDGKGIKVVIE